MSILGQRTLASLLQATQKGFISTRVLPKTGNLYYAREFDGVRQSHFRHLSSSSKLSSPPKRKATKSPFKKRVKDLTRISPGPRYVQGPTLEALRIVVKVLQTNDRMHTRDIYKFIHENFTGEEFTGPEPRPQSLTKGRGGVYKPQIPEPEHPQHPVRSMHYLKTVLLATLEANGRARKVVVEREPTVEETEKLEKLLAKQKRRGTAKDNDQAESLVKEWLWELIPPMEGVTPIEERDSIYQKEADHIYFQRLNDSAMTSPGEQSSKEGLALVPTSNAHSWSTDVSQERELSMTNGEYSTGRILGDALAAKWRETTRKDRQYPLKHGARIRTTATPGSKIEWVDAEAKTEKRIAARERVFGDEYGKHPTTTKAVELFSTRQGSDSGSKDLEEPPHMRIKQKPHNPNFPEYKQPKQGVNNIPFALVDPRRREIGFNYGLPKQKKLLKAANARDYDQKEWKYQPARDLTHLSPRRRRARDEQGRQSTAELREREKERARMDPSGAAF